MSDSESNSNAFQCNDIFSGIKIIDDSNFDKNKEKTVEGSGNQETFQNLSNIVQGLTNQLNSLQEN